MSQAEDLLNSLSENDISTKTEPHIVVGSNRVITVPSELNRIAVQYDHNIETVPFDCPRYWDDHDMSTMKVYINYTRADNEPGCYIADDVAVDETDTSIMHFSWTISRHVTEAVGPLAILVCIKMVDADGNEVNHWNSERNTDMTISQGMECGDIIVNKYPDVITYLLADMGNLADLTTEDKSSLVAAINEAVDMDAVKLPKFTKLLTHTITEDELAASPIAFIWGTAQIPNLNDFNVFALTIVRPDGAKIEFKKWVRLKINNTLLGNICGTSMAASPTYAITANRLFGAWISGNYYDPRNIGVPVLVPPGSSSTFQSGLPDSEPVTSIGFTSYVADYGLTAGIVVELWGAK